MKNNKSIFKNQLPTTIGKKAVDIETEVNDLESQIKEVRLCLDSILNTSNLELRESLLYTFLKSLIEKKVSGTSKPLLKVDNVDFKQFDKIADLIEDELDYLKLPKDINNSSVLKVIRDEGKSVGIATDSSEAFSDEALELIAFLDNRWNQYQERA